MAREHNLVVTNYPLLKLRTDTTSAIGSARTRHHVKESHIPLGAPVISTSTNLRWRQNKRRMAEPRDMVSDTIYRCSDGNYYGGVDLWSRFESGVWKPCWWDTNSMEEWVETHRGELLVLVPISRSSLPEEVQTECVTGGISVSRSGGGAE